MEKWKTISSKLAFDNRWFKVQQDTVELPNGRILDDYFMWKEGDVGMVVPITTDQKLVTVFQYKHAYGDFLIEFPAGYIEANENPAEATKRELLEETGYIASNLIHLQSATNNPTKVIGRHHLYLSTNVTKSPVLTNRLDDNEEILVKLFSISEFRKLISSGKITATDTIASFTWLWKNSVH